MPAHRRHHVDHGQGRHRARPARGGHSLLRLASIAGARYVEPHLRLLGAPVYERIDAAATAEQKRLLLQLSPDRVDAQELAGEAIRAVLTTAPGNGESIGGLKVIADDGWFAVRPSGTEEVYKDAESFRYGPDLERIQAEAQALVAGLFAQQERP